ncbi:tetratricopeptide repeat protein, partial [uncultured Actinomyces sp.]|uniref:tetratricopeptide repeat protein n=1 Tax=uncultured Actinomyces sp. TaxID=249061 RepID=UPI002803EF13
SIATLLLGILSLLAASGVPTHWLLDIDDDSDAVRDTLSFLKSASILQESIDGNKTIIHRLQGQVYRETYLSNQEKFGEALTYTTAVLNKVKIESLDNFEDQRQEVRDLVEQIGAVTSQSHSHPLFSDPTFVSILATTLRDATDVGMPQLALTLTESVTQASNLLGTDHPDTLSTRNNLANAYRAAGRLNDATPLLEETLEALTRALGPNHPHTLDTRHNLAEAYRAAGRFEDADKLFETPSGSEDEQDGTEEDPDQESGD